MFRGAVRGDLPQILKIYAHARAVMKASGNPTQWGDNFPPQELLQKHRMETAARLLRRSDMNIQQIISLVGYENTSYFYRLFHERYGLSPREYRLVRTGHGRASA